MSGIPKPFPLPSLHLSLLDTAIILWKEAFVEIKKIIEIHFYVHMVENKEGIIGLLTGP